MSLYLTTYDNPFDPSTNFDQWFQFDTIKGYNSCGYLAKIVGETNVLSEEETDLVVDAAIKSIVETDPRGIYLYIDPLSKKETLLSGTRVDSKTQKEFVLK